MNYPNSRGGCYNGFCEMPINIKLFGYKEFADNNTALCYNCKKTDECKGIKCNMCCEKQKDQILYPTLDSPDYAYQNDFNERIKHSDYFTKKKLAPIKLIV